MAGEPQVVSARSGTKTAGVAPTASADAGAGVGRKSTMRLEDDIDFSTLAWVKPQIDEILSQARQSLEAYVDDPSDAGLMRSCAEQLHQVHGTLRMVELYGAARLSEEMERLALAVLDGKVGDRDEAYGVLMRGLMQLPDYLELIQTGHKDIPVVLLPLLNELRAGRGEPHVPESALFLPDLDRPLPPDAAGARAALPFADLRRRVTQIRARYEALLLVWVQGQPPRFAEMRGCVDELRAVCHAVPARRLWWITGGVLEALEQGRLDQHEETLRQQFARLDHAIRRLQDQGEDACDDDASRELARTLLYHVAHAAPGPGRTEAISRCFALENLVPAPDELERARASMAGRNRALLDTVARAVREDLLRVKEGLDIFLRREDHDTRDLEPQLDTLRRVGDTLGMLGLDTPRSVVNEQRQIVADIGEGRRAAEPETVLDVAGALLYVDAALDEHIERLGASPAGGGGSDALPRTEARKIVQALMREAGFNLARVKDDVVAFIESPWMHDRLATVPGLLDEVSGALRMLDLQRPASLLDGINRYVENELITDRRVPTVEQMDTLADAVAGIEYYLEVRRDARAGDERILDGTQRSLEALGYWPVPERRIGEAPAVAAVTGRDEPAATHPLDEAVSVAAGKGVDDLIVGEAGMIPLVAQDMSGLKLVETEPTRPPSPVDTRGEGEWIEIEETVLEPVTGAAPAATTFQEAAGIDEEIREVFVEEVGEEIAGINANLPAWKADPQNLEALTPVRRSFHTLKGSGRLVGAVALGEFAWKVENMLNRVLDHTIAPGAEVQALVDEAVATLPKLLAALKGEAVTIDPPLDAIMQAADKLAAGEPARVSDFTQGYHKVVRKVRRWVPRAPAIESSSAPEPPAAEETPALAGEAAGPAGPQAVLPTVDPALLEVLRTEVGQHLDTLRDYLARSAEQPQPVDEAMVRTAHTLHGAVAMVGIDALTSVLAPMETWFKRARAAQVPLDREGRDALRDTVALSEHVIAQFDAPVPDVPDTTVLTERVVALRDSLPEHPLAAALDEAWHVDQVQAVTDGVPHEVPVEAVPGRAEASLAEAAGPAAPEDGVAQFLAAGSTLPTAEDTTTLSAQELAAEEAAVRAEAARRAAEQAEADRLAAEKAEAKRAAAETAEAERLAAERAEAERLAAERAEAERIEAENAEALRIAMEKLEAERTAAQRAEAERLVAQQAEAERLAAERAEAERVAAEQAEAERLAAEQAEAERLAAERAEAERLAAEQAEAERLAAERTAAEKAEAERTAAEKAEAERSAAEKAEAIRIAAEKAEAGRAAAEKAKAARIAADNAERARRQTERAIKLARMPAFPDDSQPDGALELPDLDPDLIELFTQEGSEILDHSDGLMATLRETPEDRDALHGLQRDLHTLKGGARVVGLAPIGDLGHAMETLMETLADGSRTADPEVIESLEGGFDRLHQLLQRVIRGQAIAMPVNAIARFEALARGESPSAPQAETRPAVPARTAAPAPRAAPSFDDEPRAPQEMIRVRSDLLDSLVNYAGEVSIYRSRLEQQVSNFRFNLVELEQTVARLREQLRKLEIETEAQILSRYQRENEGGHAAFDPLELDRYSQLQQYSRALAESVSDLASLQGILDDQARQSETLLLQQSRVSSDLQEGLMRTRMVPFESMVPNLRRTLRQAASELGKRAQLRVEGAQGEMDRNVLERMKAPFEHMLRNALAHGIEDPATRLALGKPEEGTVTIAVGREATEVLIRVSDDGAGFDRDAIRAKAIEHGLLHPDAQLSDRDLYAFVLETGFSTAESVNQLAGRGVGMDVVASEIKQLGGTLSIESQRGQGTTFHIRLPFTLAVTQAIMVRTGESVFAVPMTSIQGVARISRAEMEKRVASGEMTFAYAGEDYALYDLSQLLGQPASHNVEEGQLPLLMVRSGDLRAAVRVDAVVGSREIVVKPVGPQVSKVPGIFGATIMGDGSVLLILDTASLVRRAAALHESAAPAAPAEPVVAVPAREQGRQPMVMVVDDSITMRKVTTRVLERQGLEAVTAKDGLDAVEKLQERVPDLMLLDIEMPRMDGYELATYMKNDPRLRDVPIIMITSRTGEKHRQRALEIGVDRYLGKPYSEADLLRNVNEMLETSHV